MNNLWKIIIANFKLLIYCFIYFTGFFIIIRNIYFKRFKNQTRVLYIHRVLDKSVPYYDFLRILGHINIQEFEKRIKYLSRFYNIISLNDYFNSLENEKQIERGLVLTFDDGYRCFYNNVFPILKKYNIPATVFITTGFIENNEDIFWHDKLIYLIASTKEREFSCKEISIKRYKLRNSKDKNKFYNNMSRILKEFNINERNEIINKLFLALNGNENELKKTDQMLTWTQIREMHASGLVSFGAHTVSHPILTRVSLETAENEIKNSKEHIEKILNCYIKFFAYPNGSHDDFNTEIIDLIKKSGYSLSFTTINKTNKNYAPYEMSRHGIIREPFFMFALQMSGMNNLFHYIKGRIYHLKNNL